jgi:hypothetical protein
MERKGLVRSPPHLEFSNFTRNELRNRMETRKGLLDPYLDLKLFYDLHAAGVYPDLNGFEGWMDKK